MTEILIRGILGAGAGAGCKLAGDELINRLLKKRGKEYAETKRERILLFSLLSVFGALIACLVPFSPELLFYYLLLIICEAVAVIDTHFRIIPNDLVVAILLLSILFGLPGFFGLSGFHRWKPLSALIGMVGCLVIFTLPALLSRKVGAGDIKLAAAMGFCMGLGGSLLAIGVMGVFVLAYTLLQSKMPAVKFMLSSIPMGPFLALSMLAVLLAIRLPVVEELVSVLPF